MLLPYWRVRCSYHIGGLLLTKLVGASWEKDFCKQNPPRGVKSDFYSSLSHLCFLYSTIVYKVSFPDASSASSLPLSIALF